MRRIRAVSVLLAAVTLTGVTAVGQDDPLLEKSREVTAEFAARMQAALQRGMAAGGPVGAIGACRDEAPEIAAALSAESGAMVSRTSLKVRNPDNAAEDWQAGVLARFDSEGAGAEYFERTDDGARYMKAIPTGALCLNCHGTVIPPDIDRKLDEAYPDDEARGYYLGDVRGAFSVVWPDSN
jgi:hypothetical protein